MKPIEQPTLGDIERARQRIAGSALRTPLVPLRVEGAPAEIFLKLENLQPIGSFKIRGAGNAMRIATREALQGGVYTASAGNMAQGVAWNARDMGVSCRVIVPDHAPKTKLDAIERLGGEVIPVSFDDWWRVLIEHDYPGMDGLFIHPVSNTGVIAGNGTIGLEIIEDLPDVDTVLVPFGGGGLSSGIAAALRAVKPDTKVFACEVETAAPLAASLRAGRPQAVDYTASFVDGIGGKGVLEEMWPLVSTLIDDSIVVALDDVARAMRLLLERNRIVAEGAGAVSVAAALSGRTIGRKLTGAPDNVGRKLTRAPDNVGNKIVCVVSGGNIDLDKLVEVIKSVD